MKEIYTFTANKTASVSDFSLLLLDYLSRDDEDVKTFGTLVKDMDGHTVMEIDSDEDTILFDRHLLQDVLKDVMNDVASLARANLVSSDEDESEKEGAVDAVDDADKGGIDDDEWEMDDEEGDGEEDKDMDRPSVTTADGTTFHVGDRVRAVYGSCTHKYAAGELGRIIAVDRTDEILPLYVRFDEGGRTTWMDETNLTILPE